MACLGDSDEEGAAWVWAGRMCMGVVGALQSPAGFVLRAEAAYV